MGNNQSKTKKSPYDNKKIRYRSFIVRIMAKGRVPPKKMYKCDLQPFRGGGLSKPYPLIVKYIHKGNIHDF